MQARCSCRCPVQREKAAFSGMSSQGIEFVWFNGTTGVSGQVDSVASKVVLTREFAATFEVIACATVLSGVPFESQSGACPLKHRVSASEVLPGTGDVWRQQQPHIGSDTVNPPWPNCSCGGLAELRDSFECIPTQSFQNIFSSDSASVELSNQQADARP